jgi:decaprenylphospho-beta-D-erythro-pentofuranosid-2-ulose 2-reductase
MSTSGAYVYFAATSSIAEHVARRHAKRGVAMVLVGRHADRLDAVAADLIARGALSVDVVVADLANCSLHEAVVVDIVRRFGRIEMALVAQGVLQDHDALMQDADALVKGFHLNATSVISVVHTLAQHMLSNGGGTVGVLSSVAGDRGRKTLFAYCAAKAAVSAFCDGLRMRLHGTGVRIVTIKPGVIRTPMTAGRKIAPISSSVDVAARIIERILDGSSRSVYVPWFWRPVMFGVRHLPEGLLRRSGF